MRLIDSRGVRGGKVLLLAGISTVMGLGSAQAETETVAPSSPAKASPAAPPIPAPTSGPQAAAGPGEAMTVPAETPLPPPAYPPPGYAYPPPGYAYPPPGYAYPPPGYAYPPPGYPMPSYAPPPPPISHRRATPFPQYEAPLPDEEREIGSPKRPLTLSLGFGLGSLSGSFSSQGKRFRIAEPGLTYAVHLSVAANESWLVTMGLDGTWAEFSDSRLESHASWSSTAYTIGAQYFIKPWLYSRLGVGLGCLQRSDEQHDDFNCKGMAAAGGVGMEFVQQQNLSFAAELAGSIVRYTTFGEGNGGDDLNEIWYSLGANLVLSFF